MLKLISKPNYRLVWLTLAGATMTLLAGCYGTMETSTYPYEPGYVSTQPVYAGPYVADDYLYYPQAEVYYSTARHEYIYPQGGGWVRQYAAPRVNAWGPAVHLSFRDGPERHHDEVVRQYPRNWQGRGDDRDRNRDRDRDRDRH